MASPSTIRLESRSFFNNPTYLNKCALTLAVTGVAHAIFCRLDFSDYGISSKALIAPGLKIINASFFIIAVSLRILAIKASRLNINHNSSEESSNTSATAEVQTESKLSPEIPCEHFEHEPARQVLEKIRQAHTSRSQELFLSKLSLHTLPKEIGLLTQLSYLDLSGNRLKCLPAEIGLLTTLRYLILIDNQLEYLPEQVGLLIELTHLTLINNHLQHLPAAIGKLNKLYSLFLTDNQLKSLPNEICSLSNLRDLYFYGNAFEEFPEELMSLTGLEKLYFGQNHLQALPETIGRLTRLQTLDLKFNRLQALPEAIGSLTRLQRLDLTSNRLQALPVAIGCLRSLRFLYLDNNELQTLPTEMGFMYALRNLHLNANQNLRELPLTLATLENLHVISISETQIQNSQCRLILDTIERYNNEIAADQLPGLIEFWKQYAQEDTLDLTFIEKYHETEKQQLYQWLTRLARTQDFKGSQASLAFIVCQIMASLKNNLDFKDSFFAQIRFNLEGCQDRAAMALNEIYTSWKLATLPTDCSLKDKLKILVGIAKTLALRVAIAQAISDRKNKGYRIQESVEIYLYFETVLKQKLELVTAINCMTYSQIGKVDWITSEELACQVSETYIDHLMDIPSCETLMNQDSEFMVAKQDLLVAYEKARDRKRPDAETLAADDQLKKDVRQLTIKWVEKAMQVSA